MAVCLLLSVHHTVIGYLQSLLFVWFPWLYLKNNNCICDVDISETVHELVIVRLSLMTGSVIGGDEMIILCEKVRKGDVISYCSSFLDVIRMKLCYEIFVQES